MIQMGESPYAYVRITVMRSLLIPSAQYPKLMKMGLSEISHYLGETQYRKEVTEMGLTYSGIALIEKALLQNFIHTIMKLKRISPESFTPFIDHYLLKYDILNLKTIIRAKMAHIPTEETMRILQPAGIIREDMAKSLLGMGDVDEIIKSLPDTLKRYGKYYASLKNKSLFEIENSLDRFCYDELLSFTSCIPTQGEHYKQFLLTSIHISNLLTFFRLKKAGMSSSQIQERLFFTKDDIENMLYRRLLRASDEAIPEILATSHYRHIFKNLPTMKSLIPLEIQLYNHLMKKALRFQHQNPLSVYSILSFLFAKEMEIANIRKIVQAKHLGVAMEKVEPQLVII